MAGFEKSIAELRSLGVAVFAASVDPIEKAREVANELSFPIGYGVTRETADLLGSWWNSRRDCIEPSEFVVAPDGRIAASSYSSGPLGRMEGAEVARLVRFLASRA